MAVEEQIVQIYAVTTQKDKASKESWARKYAVEEIPRYVSELLAFMRVKHANILQDLRENPKVKIDDTMRGRLNGALTEFDKMFDGKTESE